MKEKKEEKKMHLNIDNLAMPEVIFGEEDSTEEEDNEKKEVFIDYSGAIPEIHIKKNK